jgi:hypothetical protein
MLTIYALLRDSEKRVAQFLLLRLTESGVFACWRNDPFRAGPLALKRFRSLSVLMQARSLTRRVRVRAPRAATLREWTAREARSPTRFAY